MGQVEQVVAKGIISNVPACFCLLLLTLSFPVSTYGTGKTLVVAKGIMSNVSTCSCLLLNLSYPVPAGAHGTSKTSVVAKGILSNV